MGLSPLMELFGSIASSGINMYSQQQQNQHNEYLAQLQNQWNRQQWMNEALYNSPSNQMARLRAAGINPALAYTNGIDNLAPASPEMVSSQGVAPNFGNPFSGFTQDVKTDELMTAQRENIEADTKLKLANAGLTEIRSKIAGVDLIIKLKNGEKLSDLAVQSLETSIDKMQAEIKNIDSNTALQLLEGEKLRKYIDEKMPAEIEELKSKTGLNDAQAKEILELLPIKILLNKAMANQANAMANQANANARLATLQGDFQKRLNESDTYVQSIIDSAEFDALGKLVNVSIDAGSNVSVMRIGASELGIANRGNVRGSGDSDAVVSTISTVFSICGKLFSVILK